MKPLNGRRLARAEAEIRYRWIDKEPSPAVRTGKLGPRRVRRTQESFRPIYGHAIPVNPPHKDAIWALKAKNIDVASSV